MLELYKQEISNVIDGEYYGIDLGTTNTVITCIDVKDITQGIGKLPVKLITIPQYSPLDFDGHDQSEMVASILGVNDKDEMFVGNKMYKLKGHPDFIKDKNIFYHWKLDLGVSIKPLYKHATREDLNDAAKVAGKILNYCRRVHFNEDKTWNNVIVTVPASFQANQRQDVLQAIDYANIKRDDQMLIDEPNAAFVGYLNEASVEEKGQLFSSSTSNVLVVDFGGGTCDLSVIKINKPQNMQLKISNLAISRYNDLGGQDLDSIIAELYLLPKFLNENSNIDFSSCKIEKMIMPQLSIIAEKLKIDLVRTISTRYLSYDNIPDDSDIKSVIKDQTIVLDNNLFSIKECTLSFKQFREVNKHIFTNNEYQLQLVDKVIQSVPSVVKDILAKSNLKFSDISNVLFVGGSVQNLIFVQETMNLFSNATALIPSRSDLLIAKGAAVYGFYKNALGIELLQPISSDTIGVILHNTPFYPIIEAGKGLPYSVDLPDFSTNTDLQTEVTIPFCINTEENTIGELKFKLPRFLTKDDVISIKANLTLDKIFNVEVYVDDELLGKMELINPYVLANVSKEERKLQEILLELDNARVHSNTNKEKDLLYNLVYEYYNLGNHTRAATLGEEWLNTFDKTSANMNNIVFCAYDALGNRKKARQHLEQGLKYSPNNSSLCYNMSLQIEKEKNAKAALTYLTSLPKHLQNGDSIKFRIALLSYYQNDKTPAQTVAKEYQDGQHRVISEFSHNLLKRVLKIMNIDIESYNRTSESDEEQTVNRKNLLRSNASALVRHNE